MNPEQQKSLDGARAQERRDKEARENFIEFQMDSGLSREDAEKKAEDNLDSLSKESAHRIRKQQKTENNTRRPDSVMTRGTRSTGSPPDTTRDERRTRDILARIGSPIRITRASGDGSRNTSRGSGGNETGSGTSRPPRGQYRR